MDENEVNEEFEIRIYVRLYVDIKYDASRLSKSIDHNKHLTAVVTKSSANHAF